MHLSLLSIMDCLCIDGTIMASCMTCCFHKVLILKLGDVTKQDHISVVGWKPNERKFNVGDWRA